MGTVAELVSGELLVLSLAMPGAANENIGVLLRDPATDRAYQKFRPDLPELAEDELDREYLDELPADLEIKARSMGATGLLGWLEENASNLVRAIDRERVSVEDWDRALSRLYRRHVTPRILPFRTHLPLYSVQAAAGKWGPNLEVDQEPEAWLEAPEGLRITEDMFLAHVTGRSMEPRIPAGSLCIFRGGAALAGSRQGKLVLVMNYGEPGENRFTIKRYKSIKRQTEEGWAHNSIVLEPLNPEYEAWELTEDSRIQVVGEFVQVLETSSETE